ncbi:MAG: fumarate hydratase [Nitrososphaerota archaeon]|nr:fumarate hydratase [Nitrososphaerota archaeon]
MSINYSLIEETVKNLYIKALKIAPPDLVIALKKAYDSETSDLAKRILQTILSNVQTAKDRDMLICQDTGTPVYFVKIGSNLCINGIKLYEAICNGTKRATLEHPIRPNIVHPITRINTGTNVGNNIPVIHYEFFDGDYLAIMCMPKGSGSENMSFMSMLLPADGIAGIKKFVIDAVIESGGKPCPPTVIGVGIGGTSDLVTLLAKKALIRPVGSHNPDPQIARLENELYEAINSTGIGPMGMGGKNTCLAVHIESAYTHISHNPVAINTQCWAARRAGAKIYTNGEVEEVWEI